MTELCFALLVAPLLINGQLPCGPCSPPVHCIRQESLPGTMQKYCIHKYRGFDIVDEVSTLELCGLHGLWKSRLAAPAGAANRAVTRI